MKALTANTSQEERVMAEFTSAFDSSPSVIYEGRTYASKAEVFSRLSCARPTAYKWFSMVSQFFETARIGNKVLIRLDDSSDWRYELMAGSMSVEDYSALGRWDRVSTVMRNSIEITAMMHTIEGLMQHEGFIFKDYAGVVRDIDKQLSEQNRATRRLLNAFRKLEVDN
mgnify:CR=1 FL=1